MPEIPEQVDSLLRSAISKKRLIRFWYEGKERVAEPHDYGIQRAKVRLLTYQVGGQSNSGTLPAWRWFEVSKISRFEVLDQTFSGGRVVPSGKHHNWDELFLRVGGVDEDSQSS